MKRQKIPFFIFFTLVLIISGIFLKAQAPEKISYQMVVRDDSGELVRSQAVGVQVSILQGSAEGSAVYVEAHTPTTNVNGLATLEMGNGKPVSGKFSTIEWVFGPYFLKVETDLTGGTSYTITGTTEILSVPYALYAKSVENETQTLANVAALGNSVNTQLKSVTDPTEAQDAATKAYVDVLKAEITKLKKTNEAGGGIFDERDGNYYNTVKIGEQVWMAENLAYLPAVSPSSAESYTEPYYYVYGYEGSDISAAKATDNYGTYGVLYNWPAALTACPVGCHLPNDAEWTQLGNYLIDNGYGYGGSGNGIAKALASTTNWASSGSAGTPGDDLSSNNSSGFDALPGGYRSGLGFFIHVSNYSYWWSATENEIDNAWSRRLYYDYSGVLRSFYDCEFGFSVRCLRN